MLVKGATGGGMDEVSLYSRVMISDIFVNTSFIHNFLFHGIQRFVHMTRYRKHISTTIGTLLSIKGSSQPYVTLKTNLSAANGRATSAIWENIFHVIVYCYMFRYIFFLMFNWNNWMIVTIRLNTESIKALNDKKGHHKGQHTLPKYSTGSPMI